MAGQKKRSGAGNLPEEALLDNIVRAAKKSNEPSRIAKAYGILADKVSQSDHTMSAKLEEVARVLLGEIKRAAKGNNDPEHIAIAFGIVMDKKGFGLKKSEKKTKDVGPMKKKDRMHAYDELNG